ncbi:hypothetical protein [Streptomyces sp. NPDC091040]
MLDGCGQRENVGPVLDEPLPDRRTDRSVQEVSADQDLRPGAGLGDGGLG